MKDSILWLQLEPRSKSKGQDLYSSIKDLNEWLSRNSKINKIDQFRLYSSLLVEVNGLDIAVNERLEFLDCMHSSVIDLIQKLTKKSIYSGLPFTAEKSNNIDSINTLWSEMVLAYKIIIEDILKSNFLNLFSKKKYLKYALCQLLYHLESQLFSNYMLFAVIPVNLWRDIHQTYHLASKRKIHNKTVDIGLSKQQSIEGLYNKILLFALANPYQLTVEEKRLLWDNLDKLSKYVQVNTNSSMAQNKNYPFIIQPYRDRPPFPNYINKPNPEMEAYKGLNFTLHSIWAMRTSKLIKHLTKKNSLPEISNYFRNKLLRSWTANYTRNENRNDIIESVVIVMGGTCISHFLFKIDKEPKLLNLDSSETKELSFSPYTEYQGYLIDESNSGYRLKISHNIEDSILPSIGEVIAMKHQDDTIHIGYLRWMRENKEGDIEFGVEHLSTMAEPVQLTKSVNQADKNKSDVTSTLDSFVFPGTQEHSFKPILFTHSFIEKIHDQRDGDLMLNHKTGTIKIKLVQKIDEVLSYSLYLFEKSDVD